MAIVRADYPMEGREEKEASKQAAVVKFGVSVGRQTEEEDDECFDVGFNMDVNFDEAMYHRLKNNEASDTAFTIEFTPNPDVYYAHKVDWEKEGDLLINNNAHIKHLRIYVYGSQVAC